MALQHLRSSTANKRPTPAGMSDGQLALNTNDASPGLFFKDSNGALVKVGPVHVGTTAPNATPGAGGSSGNSIGEQWLDTTGGTYVFKTWDGSAWRSESGTFVDVNGDVMTGALGIIAGSAGSPGLYFSGDTNTGLYSPGADQVAISTGGSGRLFVDASGNVGIGTASPVRKLNLVSTGEVYQKFSNNSTGSSVTDGFDIGLGSANTAYIWNYEADSTVFATNGTERLRITSAGLVGVGASSPSSLFTVGGGGTANPAATAQIHGSDSNVYRLKLTSTDFPTNTRWLGLGFGYSDNYMKAGIIAEAKDNNGRANLHFCLNGEATSANASLSDSRMVVTHEGRVGVGTTPEEALDVNGAVVWRGSLASGKTSAGALDRSGNELRIRAYGATAGTGQLVFRTGGGGGSVDSEAMRIDSSQRVGIGTSSPNLALHVSSGTAAGINNVAILKGGGSSSGQGAGLVLSPDSANTYNTWLGSRVATAFGGANWGCDLILSTNNNSAADNLTERMRITSAGNVGIGTTSPDVKLHVATGNATGYIKIDCGTSTSASAGLLFRSDSNSYSASIDHYQSTLAFSTASTERARIDSSGRLLVGTSSAPSNGELLRVTKASSGTEGAAINLFGEYSLADDASQTITLPHAALIMVTDQTTGRAGLLFATYDSATITTVSDPSNIIATSDTDTKLCVFKSAGTNSITVKNRLGAARNIGVGKITIL